MQGLLLQDYLEGAKARALRSLVEWLKIPSISADPSHLADVQASAAFCASLLEDAGMQDICVLTEGDGAPAVYAEWLDAGEGAPTVLVYGHHDVQPVDPVGQWATPPFEPVVDAGEVRARGASDDKGQVLMQVEAVRGLLRETGKLPVNLKILIEGEEEVGSPHFVDLLQRERERLQADLVVVSDTDMVAAGTPSTALSMRGLVTFDIAIRTATSDLHSGIWGGTVPNAALVAARLAACLHDSNHRVAVPGFYERVRELTAEEAASLAAVPFDEKSYCRQAGVAYLEGEDGRSPLERTGARPTAEVVGICSGYGGPGMKTIVPATANLKVAMRLVADQRPEEVAEAFRHWARACVPEGAELTLTPHGAVAPLSTNAGHPAVQALSRAIERVWGKPPLFTRTGGSGPEESLARVLAAPVIFLGIGLPEDNFHAPNERLDLGQLWRGVLAAGELLVELASEPALR